MRERLRIRKIVDRDKVDVLITDTRAHHGPAYATETINADFNTHFG